MKKLFLIIFVFITSFPVVFGDTRFTHFTFFGKIPYNNSAHVKFQTYTRSKQDCAAQCLEDLDCIAIEMCTSKQILVCRITTEYPGTYSASPESTCRRYLMNNSCRERYWDTLQNNCGEVGSTTGDAVTTSESNSTTPTNPKSILTSEVTDSSKQTNPTSIAISEFTDTRTSKDSGTSTLQLTDSTSTKDSATSTTTELLDLTTTGGSETNDTVSTAEVTTLTQTTTTACFDCDCALTVAGTSVSGERKFILSNNKFVLCILDAVQNHKWTVIQRRSSSGGQSFDNDWIDYELGFGTLASEFWIGNQYIHELTSVYGHTHLRIDMVASSGHVGFAEYTFSVDDTSQDYRLHTSNYVGNRGDPLTSTGLCTECADGMKFTTRDRDNDLQNLRNCATLSRGGWWHNACQRSNLNGQFGQSNYLYGLNWDGFTDIMSVEMKVRRP